MAIKRMQLRVFECLQRAGERMIMFQTLEGHKAGVYGEVRRVYFVTVLVACRGKSWSD